MASKERESLAKQLVDHETRQKAPPPGRKFIAQRPVLTAPKGDSHDGSDTAAGDGRSTPGGNVTA